MDKELPVGSIGYDNSYKYVPRAAIAEAAAEIEEKVEPEPCGAICEVGPLIPVTYSRPAPRYQPARRDTRYRTVVPRAAPKYRQPVYRKATPVARPPRVATNQASVFNIGSNVDNVNNGVNLIDNRGRSGLRNIGFSGGI